MTDLARRRLALGLLAFCAVLTVGTMVLMLVEAARHQVEIPSVDFVNALLFFADGLLFAAVGTLIAYRQTRSTIGWLLLTVGLTWAVGMSGSIYADYGVNVAPGSVPAPALVGALVAGGGSLPWASWPPSWCCCSRTATCLRAAGGGSPGCPRPS